MSSLFPHSPFVLPLSRFSSTRALSTSALVLMGALAAAPALATKVEQRAEMLGHTGYFREQCFKLPAGELEFSFTVPVAVDFNIHHHIGSDTHYLVKQVVERELSAKEPIDAAGEYCFMWQNLADSPSEYTIELFYQVR